MDDIILSLITAGVLAEENKDKAIVAVKPIFDAENVKNEALQTKLTELESTYEAKLTEQKADLDKQLEDAKANGKAEVTTALEEKIKSIEGERDEYITKAKKATREATINKILAENNVADAELASLFLDKHLSENDSGELQITLGGETLSVENGSKKLFENKPSLLKASGTAGSGGEQHRGEFKDLNKSDFLQMTPSEQASALRDNPKLLD